MLEDNEGIDGDASAISMQEIGQSLPIDFLLSGPVSPEGMQRFVRELLAAAQTGVRTLRLEGNAINIPESMGIDGIVQQPENEMIRENFMLFFQELAKSPVTENIDIQGSDIGDGVFDAFLATKLELQSLARARGALAEDALTRLRLVDIGLGDRSVTHLCEYLRGAHRLQEVDLSGNRFNERAQHEILQAIAENPSITAVNFEGLSPTNAQYLQDILSQKGVDKAISERDPMEAFVHGVQQLMRSKEQEKVLEKQAMTLSRKSADPLYPEAQENILMFVSRLRDALTAYRVSMQAIQSGYIEKHEQDDILALAADGGAEIIKEFTGVNLKALSLIPVLSGEEKGIHSRRVTTVGDWLQHKRKSKQRKKDRSAFRSMEGIVARESNLFLLIAVRLAETYQEAIKRMASEEDMQLFVQAVTRKVAMTLEGMGENHTLLAALKSLENERVSGEERDSSEQAIGAIVDYILSATARPDPERQKRSQKIRQINTKERLSLLPEVEFSREGGQGAESKKKQPTLSVWDVIESERLLFENATDQPIQLRSYVSPKVSGGRRQSEHVNVQPVEFSLGPGLKFHAPAQGDAPYRRAHKGELAVCGENVMAYVDRGYAPYGGAMRELAQCYEQNPQAIMASMEQGRGRAEDREIEEALQTGASAFVPSSSPPRSSTSRSGADSGLGGRNIGDLFADIQACQAQLQRLQEELVQYQSGEKQVLSGPSSPKDIITGPSKGVPKA